MTGPERLRAEITTYPQEVGWLYDPFREKTVFLRDFTPTGEGVNQNQIQAVELIAEAFSLAEAEQKGTIIGLFGPMGGGKTTTFCLLAERLEEMGEDWLVYKHGLDLARTGERLVNHPGDVSVEARLYWELDDFDFERRVLLIDEFQFNKIDGSLAIWQFLMSRRKRGFHTVVGQLDFNYRRVPWVNTGILLPHLDRAIVLAAKCTSCERAAEFTQRSIDGRPAYVDDPEVIVGAEELYLAKCGHCHTVRGRFSTVYV